MGRVFLHHTFGISKRHVVAVSEVFGRWENLIKENISTPAMARFPATDIKVESLAESLVIARAGFYWHFKNRENYINHLLEYWLHKVTEAIIKNPDILAMEPKKRITRRIELIASR